MKHFIVSFLCLSIACSSQDDAPVDTPQADRDMSVLTDASQTIPDAGGNETDMQVSVVDMRLDLLMDQRVEMDQEVLDLEEMEDATNAPDVAVVKPSITFMAPDPLDSSKNIEVTQIAYSKEYWLVLKGLNAKDRVEITSELWGYKASATFQVSEDGTIDTKRDAPLEGSYIGADPDGLIWSMTQRTMTQGETFDITYNASSPEGLSLQATMNRQAMAQGGSIKQATDQGFVGTLIVPPGKPDTPRPALIVVGGSEGGLSSATFTGSWIAEMGYVVLALAYFREPGLPQDLTEIPLEYFDGALDWLAMQPEVEATKLGFYGGSRGGELALLMASRRKDLRAVVAHVPSGYVWGSASDLNKEAWTLNGMAIPGVNGLTNLQPTQELLPDGRVGYRYAPIFTDQITNTSLQDLERATIPVELANAAILMTAGKDDALWPSCPMSQVALDRLRAAGRSQDRLECYPDAGHAIGVPGWSTQDTYFSASTGFIMGGTPAGVGRAQRAIHRSIEAFLEAQFALK